MNRGNPHYQPNYNDYYQHLEWYEPGPDTSLWFENTKRSLAQTAYKHRVPINIAAAATVAFMTAHDYWKKQAMEKAVQESAQKKMIKADARTELMKNQYLELVRQRQRLEQAPTGLIQEQIEPSILQVEEDNIIRPPQNVIPTIIDPELPKYDVRLPLTYSGYNLVYDRSRIDAFGKDMKPLVGQMGMTRLLDFIQENYPDEAKWFVPMFSSSTGMQQSLRQNIPVPESWLDTLPDAAAKRIRGIYHPAAKKNRTKKK